MGRAGPTGPPSQGARRVPSPRRAGGAVRRARRSGGGTRARDRARPLCRGALPPADDPPRRARPAGHGRCDVAALGATPRGDRCRPRTSDRPPLPLALRAPNDTRIPFRSAPAFVVSTERLAVEVAPSRSWVGICLVGAAVEGAMCWRFGWSPALPAFCFIGAVGTVASVADVRTRRIPSHLLVPSY